MACSRLPSLSEYCKEEIVDKELIDILKKGEKQNICCGAFHCLNWNSCEKRSEYYKVLKEVYMDLAKVYIKDDFYDLTAHAKKMKDFDLNRLSAKNKPDPRDWKGFLLSVVNLAFRAVGSERLPQDITIELMKVKFEDLDYEGKYYFRDLLEEEWKVLLDYHNYLQTSLHYVKADTNDLPLMESSAFLAGIYKCLQGSFKSLGKEAKRLHIIYKELTKGQKTSNRKVKGSEEKPVLAVPSEHKEFSQSSSSSSSSSSSTTTTTSNDDNDAKESHQSFSKKRPITHQDSEKKFRQKTEYTDKTLNDHDDNDYESVDSDEFSGPIGGFTEAIKPYVKKDSSTTVLPPGNKVMEMLHTFNGTYGASNAKKGSAEHKNHQEKPSRIVDQSSSNDDNDAEEPYRDNNTGNDATDHEGIDPRHPINGLTDSIVCEVKKNPDILNWNGYESTDHEGSDSDGELLDDFFDFPYVDAIDHKRATREINADEERDKKRQRKEDNRVMVFFPRNAADDLADHEIDRNFPITGITDSILPKVEKNPVVLKCNFSAVYESFRASCLIARS